MSKTEIYAFDQDGNAYLFGSANNSWHGAPFIWNTMANKYLNTKMNFSNVDSIIELVDDDRVELYEKVMLASTLDKVIVTREQFPILLSSFEKFIKTHSVTNNLREQTKLISDIYDDKSVTALGWCQTDICADNWGNYNYRCSDEYSTPYNLKQNEHTDITEILPILKSKRMNNDDEL